MHNPIRRNKNIGTAKQGHGKNNKLVIPDRWSDLSIYWEKLKNPSVIEYTFHHHKIIFLIEPVTEGFIHAPTPDDIVFILNLLPFEHLECIDLIILRQPKKKEYILEPVWGRLAYWSNIYDFSGTGIYIEAQKIESLKKFKKNLKPDELKELERLKNDGHIIQSDKRFYYIKSDINAVRNTQLYRTLPHEVGHYVDYLESVLKPKEKITRQDEKDSLDLLYDNKTVIDKEHFAHNYAEIFIEFQKKLGNVPFNRIINIEQMISNKLKPEWFGIKYNT